MSLPARGCDVHVIIEAELQIGPPFPVFSQQLTAGAGIPCHCTEVTKEENDGQWRGKEWGKSSKITGMRARSPERQQNKWEFSKQPFSFFD